MVIMRKSILGKLTRAYLRTFPPIAKNGNNVVGDAKRAIIALLINAVGGKNSMSLVEEILTEWDRKPAI